MRPTSKALAVTQKKAARCPTHRGRYHLAEIIFLRNYELGNYEL